MSYYELGGDCAGPSSNAIVVGLRGIPVSTATPITNQTLQYIGSLWTPTAPSYIAPTYTTTVTAAGTTTLTVSSNYQQYFTGTTTQTVVLPSTATLVLGSAWIITNNSTGLVTITSDGGNVVAILPFGTSVTLTCILTSGTTAASWNGGNVGTFTVGTNPSGICYDGTNIWVSNYSSANVTKIVALTGVIVGTYTTGNGPTNLCFDGVNIWITNQSSTTVTKLLAATGALVNTYTVGNSPWGICFDGTYIWVSASTNVVKIIASSGAFIGTYTAGSGTLGICVGDNLNIWVVNTNDNTVTKFTNAGGATIGTYAVPGPFPTNLCYDGVNIWVSNNGATTVTKLLASTGAVVGSYTAGTTPRGIAYDGTYIWVSTTNDNKISKLVAATGLLVGTYTVGTSPYGVCYDGTNIWTANYGVGTTNKIGASAGVAQSAVTGIPLLTTLNNVSRDLNANTKVNNIIKGYSTYVTSAGTTALSTLSTYQHFFTGSTTHTVTLPNVTTLVLGQSFLITNNSSGAVTVQSFGANTIVIVAAGSSNILTCVLITGTSAASWTYTVSVTSITGTANQITAGTGVTLSTPSTFITPGSAASTTSLTVGTLFYEGTSASVSAAGTTQGTATALTNSYIVVTTAAANSGISLPLPTTAGLAITIINKGANPLNVYPATSGAIDAAGTNIAVSLGVNGTATYQAASTTQWYTVDTALLGTGGLSVTYGNGQSSIGVGYTTTATAGGTTTLSNISTYQQYFTGTTTQTVVLPVTSTLSLGFGYLIINKSTGLVTVTSSGGDVVAILQYNGNITLTCISIIGTTYASWSGGNIGTYAVGTTPFGVCFDGTNIWIANSGSANVTKLVAANGSLVGTYSVGTTPIAICYDGTNVWITNSGSNNVTKLLASDGSSIGTYSVGTTPWGICYDGTSVWVSNSGTTTVTKLLGSTGGTIGTYTVGTTPKSMRFDGSSVWVANSGSANVTKILGSNGSPIGTYTVGTTPSGICYDGVNIWVANAGSANVTKLTASTGAVVGTYSVGTTPNRICFDGTNVWVSNFGSANVSKLIASTGTLIATYPVGSSPVGMCYDGSSVWVVNQGSTTINKITSSQSAGNIGIPLQSTYNNISRDLNANVSMNNLIQGYTTTTTNAATTNLSALSAYQQIFTGTSTQTVVLPDVATLLLGQNYYIVNNSTNIVTVQSFGTNTVSVLSSGSSGVFVCILITGTTAASWSAADTSSSATALTIVQRDVNANTTINNVMRGYTTTVASGGTIVLSSASTYTQIVTGVTSSIMTLPIGPALGFMFQFINTCNHVNSDITVNSSAGNLVVTVPRATSTLGIGKRVMCILVGGTTAASWLAIT